MSLMRKLSCCVALLATLGLATTAQAVSFASGLRDLGGGDYEFVLNEAADDVTVSLDVGGDLSLGALGAGRHTFNIGSATSFDIAVTSSGPAGFTAIDDSANLWTSFERPGGLAINNIPSSPYFGTIYVNQNRSTSNGSPVSTVAGRVMGNGIYSLTADRIGVDLPTGAVPADLNDPTLAKLPGITFDTASSSSVYRMGMDEAGNLIVSDWSDPQGGLKYVSNDLTFGGTLLRGESGPTGGVPSDEFDNVGALPLHGSINGEPQVSGSIGNNLVVRAMDEDLDVDLQVSSANDGNSIWEWNIGNATSPVTTGPDRDIDYAATAPELVAAVGDFHTANGQDRSTSGFTCLINGDPCGTHSDGSQVFLASNIGVTANAQYNPFFNKWYVSGSRFNGDDSSSLVIFTPEGPGGDGRDIQVDWASKQFSIDNGLDGFTDDPEEPLSQDSNNDIFRNTHNVTFSPDNKYMYVQRRGVLGDNVFLGFGTALGAKILQIPLDENGLPVIEIDDNGTPGDTSDDVITNITPIFTAADQGLSGSFSQVKTDIAGNLYYSGNQSERLEYFSLGGDFVATTSNNAALTAGAFLLEEGSTPVIPGDFNGDGAVDNGDLNLLLGNWGAASVPAEWINGFDSPVDNGELNALLGNWGTGVGTAVPEPTALVMAALGLVAVGVRRR